MSIAAEKKTVHVFRETCCCKTLLLASSQRRGGVICPISPSRPSEAILKEHANDRHHGQTAICELCVEPPGFCSRVVCCKQRMFPSKVTGCVTSAVPARGFTESAVREDLDPPTNRHLGNCT